MPYEFKAMGTDITVTSHSPVSPDLLLEIEKLFHQQEKRYSRFLEDSELSRFNRSAPNQPIHASTDFYQTLQAAQYWCKQTGGIFEPAILKALCNAGYRESFSLNSCGPLISDQPTSNHSEQHNRVSICDLISEPEQTLLRPNDLTIDLGGIVKGRTVDQAMALVKNASHDDGHRNLAVNAGGDMIVRSPENGPPWVIDVENPFNPEHTLVSFSLQHGSVATSSTTRRKWLQNGYLAHHLIDPRTGQPSESDLAQVTVVAQSTEMAEIYSKTILILGSSSLDILLPTLPISAAIVVTKHLQTKTFGHLEICHD